MAENAIDKSLVKKKPFEIEEITNDKPSQGSERQYNNSNSHPSQENSVIEHAGGDGSPVVNNPVSRSQLGKRQYLSQDLLIQLKRLDSIVAEAERTSFIKLKRPTQGEQSPMLLQLPGAERKPSVNS